MFYSGLFSSDVSFEDFKKELEKFNFGLKNCDFNISDKFREFNDKLRSFSCEKKENIFFFYYISLNFLLQNLVRSGIELNINKEFKKSNSGCDISKDFNKTNFNPIINRSPSNTKSPFTKDYILSITSNNEYLNKEKSIDLHIKNNLEEYEDKNKDQILIKEHTNRNYIVENTYKNPFSKKQDFKKESADEENFNKKECLWENGKIKCQKDSIDYKQFKSISENKIQSKLDDLHSNKYLEKNQNNIKINKPLNFLKECDLKNDLKSNELQNNLNLIKPNIHNSIPNPWPGLYFPNSSAWSINILNENNRYLNPQESRMIINKNPLVNQTVEINGVSNYQKFNNQNNNVKLINNLFPNFNINNRFALNSIINNYYNNLNAFQSQVKLNNPYNVQFKHPFNEIFNNANNKKNNNYFNSNKNELNSVLKISNNSNNINIPLDETKELLNNISYKKTDLFLCSNIDKTIENQKKKENCINSEIIETSIKTRKESIKNNSNFSPYDSNLKENNDKNKIIGDKFLGLKRNKEIVSKNNFNRTKHEYNKKIKNS